MVRKFVGVVAWAAVAFIIYSTLVPLGMRPTVSWIGPNYERFAAYAVMSALMVAAYPRRVLRVALVVIAIALVLEISQLAISDRDGRVTDALVKVAGGLAGIAAASFWTRRLGRPLS